ncbi:FadR/GntR family transcriptional regulator [Acinetobacter pullicarnis]|uniref:FadR/GntR family transcriptional regulator n=1 Tax=Acinetobacter pullicarnis TaxID=2576829 RepID=UPI001E631C7D|nr:GntR family transcriptional regulator [Acinetobacter pullicarnis]
MIQTRIYQNIFNKIQEDIKNGIYPVGSKLPPERDLAQLFAVSRTSVREAIIALEVNGIVEVKLGSGVYILKTTSVHDKFHRTLILSGFCLLKIAKISLNSSFFPKPIKR